MSEIKTLNGYSLADETARAETKANAEAIAALKKDVSQRHASLTASQKAAAQQFAGLFASITGKVESFLFFADPHLCGSEDVSGRFEPWLNQIEAVYNNTPASLCICAGDWLNNSNTRENACWMLGVIEQAMKKRFDRYISVLGNHDTNYQGYEYIETGREDKTYDRSECAKCQLSAAAIRGLWYRKQGSAYFAEDGDCTRFYVFDSGLDWYDEMTPYRWEQLHWFAQTLLLEKPERAAMLMHIPTALFAGNALMIAAAYNHRTTVSVNGAAYDFSAAKGKVGFMLGGHHHCDYVYTQDGIPVILTTKLTGADGQPCFDLVLADWEENVIHLTRVGEGENRTFKMA